MRTVAWSFLRRKQEALRLGIDNQLAVEVLR